MEKVSGEPSVFYLCHSLADKALVFADELPDGLYIPGFFFIEENGEGDLSDRYSFLAQHGEKTVSLSLARQDKTRVFTVDAGSLGIFSFVAAPLDPQIKYGGAKQSLFTGARFWELGPLDMNQLETACLAHDFYFIGA